MLLYQAAVRHFKAHKILRQEVVVLLREFGLSIQEWVILSVLVSQGLKNTSELAEELSVELPMITQLTLRLEKLAYIARQTGQSDRRERYFSPSTSGRKMVERIEHKLATYLGVRFASVDREELDGYLKVLELIIDGPPPSQ